MISMSYTIISRPHPFAQLTAASVVLLGLGIVWAGVDPRLLDGVPVWAKPVKFALSFVVYFGTLALIVTAFSPKRGAGRLVRWTAWVMGAAFVTEMADMIFQAAQGQASHFNTGDPFHAAMYRLMGVGAVLLVIGPMVVGWPARTDPALGPGLRRGIWWGAVASFALTMITAGTMSSMSGHFIGPPDPEAATIPLMGWSAAVGDLRPAHFVALHALQGLILAGLWADRTGRGAEVVVGVALIWVAVTLALYAQAMMGMPLIRL